MFGKQAGSAEHALAISLPYIASRRYVRGYCRIVFSLFTCMFVIAGSGITREEFLGAPKPHSTKLFFATLLRFAIPVALGTLATQLTTIIDVVSFQKSLAIVVARNG